jgi:peptidoglycan/xylan/chitin deacetylase (PgdA/CDA1 family)
MLSTLWYSALRSAGVPAAARRLRRGAVVLCYHNVVAAPPAVGDPATHLGMDRLEDQLGWLKARYEIVPLTELVDRLEHGRPLRRVAALTFDDAYTGFFAHAWPLLKQLGLPATVFVVAGKAGSDEPFWWDRPAEPLLEETRRRYLEAFAGDEERIVATLTRPGRETPAECRPADWSDIAAAAREGLAVGAHSTTHCNLTKLADEDLNREIVCCRTLIEQQTGVTPQFFAYPYGLWNARVRASVRRCGYRAALSLSYGLANGGSDRWALPRVNVPASIGMAAFEAWAAGLWAGNIRGAPA